MAWKPKGWRSLVGGGTPDELRARVCPCEHCTRDGQHEPMCLVHDEDNPRCNCPLSQAPVAASTPIQAGRSEAVEIHYAAVFPVIATLCGVTTTPKPSASRWEVVTCPRCLEIGAQSNERARRRLEALRSRA